MRMCVDVVAGVRVSVVRVQHRSLRRVEGAGHRGEGVRAWIPCHLKTHTHTLRLFSLHVPMLKPLCDYTNVKCVFTYLVVSRMLGAGVKTFTRARAGISWSTRLQTETEREIGKKDRKIDRG